jgi:mRNA-degrading endonuclease RelE of RelBE toxin-antitoxin system
MSFNVKTLTSFEKQATKLSKKYHSLKSELLELVKSLKENPIQGDTIGKNCYKIRFAIESKGRGKSGGARIITNIHISNKIVYLLSIYDKSDKDNLTDKELTELLCNIPD